MAEGIIDIVEKRILDIHDHWEPPLSTLKRKLMKRGGDFDN
jgi:hypothetical protein